MSTASRILIAAAGAALALAQSAQAQQTAYAIANGGTTLVSFQTNNPGSVTVIGNFGGAATFLDGIGFRPSTGQLYGYLDSADSFYTINPATGTLTLASTPPSAAPTNTFDLGFAFNRLTDQARIVTDSAQNITYNAATGMTSAGSSLGYGPADINMLANPSVIANAFTQNRAGGTTPQQYGIDYGLDALVRIADDGTLTTVGALGAVTDIYTGLGIYTSPAGVDSAYAILAPAGGAPGFYNVDLNSGAATLVGNLGFTNQVYGLVVIPAPGTGAALCGMMFFGVRRRRAR